MTGYVTPDQIEPLIAGYVLCDLSPEEFETFNRLLRERPELWQQVAEAQAAFDRTFADEQVAPAHLKQSILSAYDVLNQAAQVAVEERDRPALAVVQPAIPTNNVVPLLSRWRQGIGAAAAVLIAGLSISNYLLWQSLQSLQASQRPSAEKPLVFALESTPINPARDASVKVVVNPNDLEATLNVQNLPPLKEGEVYVLWTVVKPNAPVTVDDKDAILTQVLKIDAQGRLEKQIPVPPVFRDRDLVRAMAITIEDANAPQKHVAKPILIKRI